ncbi:MAG: LTA synthase family protein [Pseudomonadota bacterium]
MLYHSPSLAWIKALASCAGFVAILYIYTLIIENYGGFSTERNTEQLIELALVVYFYGLFYAVQKPSAWRSVLAGLPILLLYLAHDIFYLTQGKVFRLVNAAELPELLQVLPLSYALLIGAILFLPLGALLLSVDYRRPRHLALWLAPLAAVIAFVVAIPNAFAHRFQQLATEIVTYSDGKSVEANGRIAMLLYREAQRINTLAALAPYRDRQAYDHQAEQLAQELRPHANRRNVHLIVLESFLDPRLFSGLRLSSPPVHPDFERLFGDKLGLSISPVFGGGTAQAEFEVLCGTPALEKVSSVEFNVFSGAPAHCLPDLLQRIGYRSVASNAYKPNFFNALPAYQGAGFAESYFPQEFSGARQTYLRFGDPGEEEYLFDGELFDQNLEFVRSHLAQHPGEPLFNYIMTIYGHTPNLIDRTKRPAFITLKSDYHDDQLERAVNQFYYRTEAIARFVEQLLAIDQNSLVILVSDHVPPLRNGLNTYDKLGYMDNGANHYYTNRIAIIEDGQPRVYAPLHHYEVPSIILDYVSRDAYCRGRPCAFKDGSQPLAREQHLEDYLRLMAHASE